VAVTVGPDTDRPVTARAVDALVDRWVDEGLVTPDQAGRMHADVATLGTRAPEGRASPVLGEALGYVGGVIILVGSVLIGAWYWDDLGTGPRLGVLLGATALLLGAGALVPSSMGDAGGRLRAVLWVTSTGAFAGALAVLAADALELDPADTNLVVSAGATTYAAALWLVGRSFLQQVAMVVAMALTATAVIARADVSDDLPGLGAWAVGTCWALLGWRGLARPGRVTLALGSALAIIGAMSTAGADAGMGLTLATVVTVLAASVALREPLLLAVGTLGALVNLPAAMTRWFPDSVGAAFGLVVVGAVLLVAAIRVTRGGGGRPQHL
jgi:hypothetical protein